MKSPRFLAALAMAAVLTTGVSAHATVGDFNHVGGSTNSGQTPMQETEKIEKNISGNPDLSILKASGDIEVNGEFTKTINSFPAPTEEGRYLRVTMPIQMNFTYNVDNHKITSAQGVISNQSVLATTDLTAPNGIKTEYQKVKMTLAGFEKSTTGTTTMGTKVKFVDTVDVVNDPDHIQLPLELNIDSTTGPVKEYSLKTIQEAGTSGGSVTIPEIEIDGNGSLTLTIDKINGQNLGNEQLITNQTTLTSHNLKLKFEYAGK